MAGERFRPRTRVGKACASVRPAQDLHAQFFDVRYAASSMQGQAARPVEYAGAALNARHPGVNWPCRWRVSPARDGRASVGDRGHENACVELAAADCRGVSEDPARLRKNGSVRDPGANWRGCHPDYAGAAQAGCASFCPQAGWPGKRKAERSSLGAARFPALSARRGGSGVASSPLAAIGRGHREGSGGDPARVAGRCGDGDTRAARRAPCHYRNAGSDRAGRTRPRQPGPRNIAASVTDKGPRHKGLARFARTLPALTPSHLCNSPTANAAPLSRKGEPEMPIEPTRREAHHANPPPTCTALRARHGGVQRDTR